VDACNAAMVRVLSGVIIPDLCLPGVDAFACKRCTSRGVATEHDAAVRRPCGSS
jgi:hypothetical protein